MTRRRQDTIDDRIAKAEETVARIKKEYDEELSKLKRLKADKAKFQQDALVKMIRKSKKSYEEIRDFLMEA